MLQQWRPMLPLSACCRRASACCAVVIFGDRAEGNKQIVDAFRERLKKVAGFGFVPEPLLMRHSRNAIVYYLFFASPKAVADKIITDIFGKYEAMR
jgi:hypothetical protein